MGRKIKLARQEAERVRKEADRALEKVREVEELVQRAEQEESQLAASVSETIDRLCMDKGMFCGVILTLQDVVNILQLMYEKRENVKIKYNLYFEEP